MEHNESESKRAHLSAVPEKSGADGRAPVARWVITLSEPLLSTRRRAVADEAMARFIARNSHWATAWFAGYLCDVTATLPPEDPWRRLSATLDLPALSRSNDADDQESRLVLENGEGAKPPVSTGAVNHDGSRFGSLADFTDLVMGELGAADLDLGLAAVADDLDDLTAAVIGFSASNPGAMESVLAKIYHHLWLAEFSGEEGEDVRPAGEVFLGVVGGALRRLIHRRRAYTGADDPFPSVVGFAWMARADRIVGSKRNVASEIGMARAAQIDPGTYDEMRSCGRE